MPDPKLGGYADLFSQFGDIFESVFGPGANRGPDLRLSISLDLAEIDAGTTRKVDVDRFVFCAACAGRGAPPEADPTSCEACGGTGGQQQQKGMFSVQTTCRECRGKGQFFEEHCSECAGEGGHVRHESLTVSVPAGVAEGQTLRLKEKGNDLGQGAGDLFCAIHVAADPRFSREGDDLHACLELMSDLDGDATIQLPFGSVRMRVPADAKSGDCVRLRGHGITKFGSPALPRPSGEQDPYRSVEASEHRGDLLVHLVNAGEASPFSDHAILGVAPDASQKEILAAYRRLAIESHPDRNPDDPEAAARFAKVSDAFERSSGRTDPMPTPPASATPPSTWMWAALLIIAAALIYAITR